MTTSDSNQTYLYFILNLKMIIFRNFVCLFINILLIISFNLNFLWLQGISSLPFIFLVFSCTYTLSLGLPFPS